MNIKTTEYFATAHSKFAVTDGSLSLKNIDPSQKNKTVFIYTINKCVV